MPSFVELKFNPFLRRLSILIDGSEPSQYSGLVQYTNEPISVWKSRILPEIYEEVRDDFYVSFIGSDSDAQIVCHYCQDFAHCLGFKAERPPVFLSARDRLIGINREIKNQKITQFGRTVIDAVFYVAHSLQQLIPNLLDIQISNLFCSVRFSANNYEPSTMNGSYSFVVGSTREECAGIMKSIIDSRAVVVFLLGDSTSEIQYLGDHYFCAAASEEELKNKVFLYLLGQPFQEAIHSCYIGMSSSDLSSPEMLKNFLIEPVVKILLNENIEVGRSAPLNFTTIPSEFPCPKLSYLVNNPEIASCDGLCVHALSVGETVLEAYYIGEKMPFWKQTISTYKRNRIKNIFLSENQMLMGCGDAISLHYSFSPTDADNVKQIKWISSDESVAKVSQNGVVYALNAGKSKIICSAENVSSICDCTVKVYLREIHSSIIEQNNGIIQMVPGQEQKLNITLEPEDCFDKELFITSSNYDIVNIANGTLIAKNAGDATITITNNTQRKQLLFQVLVRKHTPQKKSLLSLLFGE